MNIKLIGSATCPFVQRCLILFALGKVEFEMIYINLINKPDWFLKISPTAKVPILEIDGSHIFESLVINEFINEKFNLNLQTSNPLQKALNKSWSEYSSTLISSLYALICATDKDNYESLINRLTAGLNWIENSEIKLPYFNGDEISLIDIAFAPLFFRFNILNENYSTNFFIGTPKIKKWAANLLEHEIIRHTTPSNYNNLINTNILNKQGLLTSTSRLNKS